MEEAKLRLHSVEGEVVGVVLNVIHHSCAIELVVVVVRALWSQP